MNLALVFALVFLGAFVAIGAFALYLSRNIEHGEMRFDTRNRDAADEDRT